MKTTRKRRTEHVLAAAQRRRSPHGRLFDYRATLVLVAFASAFMTLAVVAYTQTSATWDEPIHLTAGYAAAARQDLRVDPSHPPLLRVWAALPILGLPVSMDSGSIDRIAPGTWLQAAYQFAHRFVYVENDADRLLYRARFMSVLLGVGLGLMLFLWTRRWLGFAPAVIALACYTFEPNLLSHASLVTTDFGIACFIFGAVYFAWRIHRGGGSWHVAGLAICFACALVSKFSGLLLVPIVAALLGISVAHRSGVTARRALIIAGVLAVTSVATIWAAYGFRYLPSSSEGWVFTLHDTSLAQRAPAVARLVEWVDSHRLLPNAYTQGLFYTHTSVKEMPAFLAGEISESGWWYYFPAAFLVKTPLPLLLLAAVGLLSCVRRRHDLGVADILFVLIPTITYLAVAMASGVNIGVRHILPIYPFVILICAAGVREIGRLRRPIAVTALSLVGVVWAAEYSRAYPHTLTFFNQLIGGPQNGHRYLADSNLGWGQALKGLKIWMDRQSVSHVNLAYFGQADPAYYDINCTYLPGAPTFAIDKTSRPKLPGYVAISATTLSGVYSPPSWRLFYRPFQQLEPVAVIGNAIRVYWVDRWPDLEPPISAAADAHRALADALLFGLQWPTRAAVHYGEYLRQRPGDADALVNYGLALVAADRTAEAMTAFRQAVETSPDHGNARLTLGKALLASRDFTAAAAHAERAVMLRPTDADAHHLRGRIRAAHGQLAAARSDFERVVELQPEHGEAREYLRRIREILPQSVGGATRASNSR